MSARFADRSVAAGRRRPRRAGRAPSCAGTALLGLVLLAPPVPAAGPVRISLPGAALERIEAPADETEVARALSRLRRGDLDGALAVIDPVVRRNPGFRLAQLVYADVLSAQHRVLGRFGDTPRDGADVEGLRDEAKLRYRYAEGPAPGTVPANVLMLSESQPEVLVVDLDAGRLYVIERNDFGPALARHAYVTIGKNGAGKRREGDQRTPVGVYFVTGRIDSEALPDFYGTGALPVNYPNEWDLRQGRTGYGIWIHGVPRRIYARVPRASDGCMVVANEDLDALWATIGGAATPVVMADGVTWEPAAVVADRAAGLARTMERWRQDWASLDAGRYARHYAAAFRSGTAERDEWLAGKRRINAKKRWAEIELSDLSAFAYPGEAEMAVVTFDQRYRSDNYSGTSRKRQYWVHEADGAWRILYEGDVQLRPEHLRGIPYSARAGIASLASD